VWEHIAAPTQVEVPTARREEALTETQSETGPDWGRRVMWAGGLLVVLVLAVLVASATVPRWWAHRVGDQVDGSITQGTTLGLVYGFVFTFLPIVAIVLILRWRRTWKTILAAVLIAVVLALPNLMTLSIVVGRGNAAHAGDRTLDVDAPAFRGASLVGAVVAGLLLVFIGWLMVSRDRAHSNARRARKDLEDATAAPSEEPPASD
jgi:glucan phosphoethanolaminetransferase (alkaline phosphatase superfamily)